MAKCKKNGDNKKTKDKKQNSATTVKKTKGRPRLCKIKKNEKTNETSKKSDDAIQVDACETNSSKKQNSATTVKKTKGRPRLRKIKKNEKTNETLKKSDGAAIQLNASETNSSNENISLASDTNKVSSNLVSGHRDKYNFRDYKSKRIFSKNQLRRADSRKIPKANLQQALDILNDEHHEVWTEKNISCLTPIHDYYEDYRALKMRNYTLKLRHARECLLRRDWKNLCRIITMFITEDNDMYYYSIYAKYAAIYLAYNDLEQFKCFMQAHNITDENHIIEMCTTLKQTLTKP